MTIEMHRTSVKTLKLRKKIRLEFLLNQYRSSSLTRAIAEHYKLLWLLLKLAQKLIFKVEMSTENKSPQMTSVYLWKAQGTSLGRIQGKHASVMRVLIVLYAHYHDHCLVKHL